MPEFIVNIYQLRIAPVGQRTSKAIKFKDASLDAIKVVDDHLMDLKNKVSEVMLFKGGIWTATRQALYLSLLKKDVDKGVFYGGVEVGSPGQFDRLRNRAGTATYTPKNDDLSMRDYFFRIEMPTDTSLGFLVVQRHGRYTAANALQQTIRRKFHGLNHTAFFRLITDSKAFDEYLNGRLAGVKALYVPRPSEARETVNKSMVLGSGLSTARNEDMDIMFKVNRPLTAAMKKQVKAWLLSEEADRPKIVTLPVEDDPDRLILCMQTDDGRQKQLHPGMIADMALTVDLTATVMRHADGRVNVESANAEAAKICAEHRPALVES